MEAHGGRGTPVDANGGRAVPPTLSGDEPATPGDEPPPAFVSIGPAPPDVAQLTKLYTSAALLLQQPRHRMADAWWRAALDLRRLDCALIVH